MMQLAQSRLQIGRDGSDKGTTLHNVDGMKVIRVSNDWATYDS